MLVGYSPQGCKEPDITKATQHTLMQAVMYLNNTSRLKGFGDLDPQKGNQRALGADISGNGKKKKKVKQRL